MTTQLTGPEFKTTQAWVVMTIYHTKSDSAESRSFRHLLPQKYPQCGHKVPEVQNLYDRLVEWTKNPPQKHDESLHNAATVALTALNTLPSSRSERK